MALAMPTPWLRALALCSSLALVACSSDGDGGGSSGDASAGSSDGSSAGGSSSGGSSGGGSSGGVDGSTSMPDESGSSGPGGACTDEFPAIVTDIDETLTVSDEEFLMQLSDGSYDPLEREGAAELVTGYAELGYRVLYLTARSQTLTVAGTNETAEEATARWLDEHGFPNDTTTTTLVLAPNLVVGEGARTFKAEQLAMFQAEGWRFDYAYGNATSDIDAYADAGIALDATFIIGEHAGESGTVAVAGEDWVDHAAAQLPTVMAVCEAASG